MLHAVGSMAAEAPVGVTVADVDASSWRRKSARRRPVPNDLEEY